MSYISAILMQRLLESRSVVKQQTLIREKTLNPIEILPQGSKTLEETMKYEGATNVMLSHEDLVRAARQYGGIPDQIKVLNVISTMEDGKPAVLVMFEQAKPGDIVYAKPKTTPSVQPEVQRSHPPKHQYACDLLAYLHHELIQMPPHMEVLDVAEHRHVMKYLGEQVYTGEVTACFRLLGDPDHYGENRPIPPVYDVSDE